jgi:four helix bundle protein
VKTNQEIVAPKQNQIMKTELEGRTKAFSVRIVRLIRSFPKTVDGIEVGRQLLRSGMSIGANYREANRAESKGDFIHKAGIAEKEASETVYWLEICAVAPLGSAEEVSALLKEAGELLAIITTIGRKAKGKTRRLTVTVALIATLVIGLFSLSRFPAFRF